MKQTIHVRRGIASGLIAAAIIAAGCGQGSGVQNVDTEPAAPSPAASLYADMSADAADAWSTDLPGVNYTATAGLAGMSADAASHWSEAETGGSTVAPNYYPHGYDYGADDATGAASTTDEPTEPDRGPLPY
jgi:hypothetical protein